MSTSHGIALYSCVQLRNSRRIRVGTVACFGTRRLNQTVGRPVEQIADVQWEDGSRTTHNIMDLVIIE